MKKDKIILISCCTLLFLLGACKEDFLNQKNYGVVNQEVFFATMNGVDQSVTATYASLNALPAGMQNLDVEYIFFGSIGADDAEAGGEQGGGDIPDVQQFDKGQAVAQGTKGVILDYYGYTYRSIMRANLTLNGIDYYKSITPIISSADAKTLNRYKGEMLFIRAFSHFKLMQVFGGVMWVDKLLGPSDAITRTPIGTLLQHIETDLINAAALLTDKGTVEVGRVNKQTAWALLGKAYLYESSYFANYGADAPQNRFAGCRNMYTKSLAYLDSVINSGLYSLPGLDGKMYDTYWNQNTSKIYPNGTPGYRYIFTVDGQNSGENVWAVQNVNDGLGYLKSNGSYITVYTTCRNIGSTTAGWGFNCPTQDLINAYEFSVNGSDTIRDPRLKATVGKNGDSAYFGTVSVSPTWYTLDCHQSPTKMIGRKWEASYAQYWTNHNDANGPNNYTYIRYADVILMAAEAAIQANIATTPVSGYTPLQLVNMVRKRARNGAATGAPEDLSSVDLPAIKHERRIEFALEGMKFFDLVRWKDQGILDGQIIQKFLGGIPQAGISTTFTFPKNDFYPLPQEEITLSNGSLVQYQGF